MKARRSVLSRMLRPKLHLVETEMEGFDVRAAVLAGSRRVVVWDTLAHPEQMNVVHALAAGLPVTVVYSHADWDHAWGTCGIEEVEQVVAHEAAAARFQDDVPAELERRRSVDGNRWQAVCLVAPTRTFAERLTLDLGNLRLELHALPGHTPDCIVGFVPRWGVLLAGDTVETPVPVVNDAAAIPGWVSALEHWRHDARVRTVVPSHGPVGGPELLHETAAYLRTLRQGGRHRRLEELPAFYRDTHERNVRLVRATPEPRSY